MSLGMKSGRKPTRQPLDRFTPVPEDELAPQPRSRSSSGSSLVRRVRSFREKESYFPSAKESAKEMKRTASPDLSRSGRSTSAAGLRGPSRSSSRGSASSKKGGMDRSISSSPHRAKKRSMLGLPDGLRPTSPSPGRPLKSAMKKSSSPTRSQNPTPSPLPSRSKSSERRTDVFSRLYPGSGGSNHMLDESDSRFAGINDTLRIRKKKDTRGSSMVDFDGVAMNAQAPGKGGRNRIEHEFTEIMVSAPMWCDRCGAFIWGLYKHAVKCKKCNLTCHKKCMDTVDLECNAQAYEEVTRRMSTTETPQPIKNGVEGFSELVDSVKVAKVRMKQTRESGGYSTAEQRHTLQHRINLYNQRQTPAHQLKFVDLTTDYQGFVRVHMCVTRPIHVSAGVTKNSWYGLMKPVRAKTRRHTRGKGKAPRRDAGRECGDNETTFYLPTDANRLVHISNTTTTLELISILLKKFCVTDHPNKFALFEEYKGDTRRMFTEEHPLDILVDSASDGRYSKLVLRDNTDGSIQWSGFSLPELSNFCLMLQREEQLHVKELRDKFTTWKRILLEVSQEKCLEAAEKVDKMQTDQVCQPQIPAH